MLTKSLHTVTAVANVAKFILARKPFNGAAPTRPAALAAAAFHALGYAITERDISEGPADDTVTRCVAACAKLLGK